LRASPIFACVALLAVTVAAQGRTFDLLSAGVADIHAAVDAGALSYERLVQLYLDRIAAYDQRGPRLRAIIALNPRALEEARGLDAERRATGRRSPLHGIPIAVKDNIDVRDLPATGGNLAFADSRPALDATVIQRLRNAGAIILAKTNLDELALGSRGFSTVGGQTLNPYDLSTNPGGSSGGTAVAVTAGFATLGLGTETGFSIRSPASNTAIVGIVPSRGLISRAGVMPISFTQDRVGAHAKSVADAAILLDVIRGFDAADLQTADGLGQVQSLSGASAALITGARVGVLGDMFRQGAAFAEFNQVILDQRTVLQRAGVAIVDALTTGTDLIAAMPGLRLNNFELRGAFDAYLLRRGPASPVRTFGDLVAGGKYLKGGTLETRFHETMKIGDLTVDAAYHRQRQAQLTLRNRLVALMDQRQVDALIYPVKSLPAPPIGTSDDGVRDNNLSAVTGLPAIVVPAGLSAAGLPIAIEFLGRPFSEARLIEIAAAYQRASRARVAPPSTPPLPGDVFRY
jgi:amidase